MKAEEYREIERLLDDDAALLHSLFKDAIQATFCLSLLKSYIDEDDMVQNELIDSATRKFGNISKWIRALHSEIREHVFGEEATK